MLFYISTSITVEDDDGEEQIPISDAYEYYIVEIREFPNAYTREIDEIIQPENPDLIPDNVSYVRPEGDAKELIYENLNIGQYDHNPAWVVLDTTPDDSVEKFIVFELDEMESPEKAGEVLRRIYRSLSRDEFDELDWEERRLQLEEDMGELVSVAGLIISLFSI